MSTRSAAGTSANASPPSEPDTIEVHLEELGEHSWVKATLNTLAGSYGSGQFRFVARPPGDHDAGQHIAVGATFPVLRFQDLNDLTKPSTWINIAVERLRELDAQLMRAGWCRDDEVGAHWWSMTYRRCLGLR